VTTYSYDAIDRPTGQSTAATINGINASRAAYTYAYNAAGLITTATASLADSSANGTTAYTYDPMGRIASFTPPASLTGQSYSWNASPDRASITTGASTVSTSFDLAHRPTSDSGGTTYTSDGEGRITALAGETLVYDALGRLASVSAAGSTIASYTYDPLDRLASATEGGVTTYFLYVGLTDTVARVVEGSAVTDHVSDLAGSELYQYDSSTDVPLFIGTDLHGDVTWTAGLDGSLMISATYDPFGNLVAASGSLPAWRWQGSWQDSTTGLYYVIARWYSPIIGSFTSDDPAVGDTDSPQARDPYAFGMGDPVDQADPSGECSYSDPSIYDPSCAAAFFGHSVAAYQRALASYQAQLEALAASIPVYQTPAAPAITCSQVNYFQNGSGGCSSQIQNGPMMLPLSPKVPWYNASDKRWNSQKMGTCGATVGYVSKEKLAEGCLVTSSAMVVGRWKGWTPLNMIQYLNAHNKIVTSKDPNKNCDMSYNWTVDGVHLSKHSLSKKITSGSDSYFLKTALPTMIVPQLLSNHPVIAEVTASGIPEHFVVVIGWQVKTTGAELVINDPRAKGGGTTLFGSGYYMCRSRPSRPDARRANLGMDGPVWYPILTIARAQEWP